MKYKVDLHTHSIVSPDGGLTEHDYRKLLKSHTLDFIAITDHNQIFFAQKMHEELGDNIIVGEEIMTKDGEVIGLFLTKRVKPGLSVSATLAAIHEQGGLSYIPHPFDILRKGIGEKLFITNLNDIDIIEGFNARVIFPLHNTKAERFGRRYNIAQGVGSDAHTALGIGHAYACVDSPFTRKTALTLLHQGLLHKRYQPVLAYLAPKLNRLRNML